jgi:GNAT superfamily N-acetyltransferase
MSIRIAYAEDVKEIATLVRSLSHYYLPQKIWSAQDSSTKSLSTKSLPSWLLSTLTEEQFLQRINSAEYSNYVYCIDDEIVGYIAMKESSHLYHLFVSEVYQGNGIANRLWKHICERCSVEKYTVRSSLYAVPVYKKWGFVETDSIKEKDGIRFQAMER